MNQNITKRPPKFRIGNIVKYRGDIYLINGFNNFDYDVRAIDFTDEEEVKTGIGFGVENSMEFLYDTLDEFIKSTLDEYQNKDKKKMYPVFRVDVCFTGYALEYKLIGAESKDDLIAHISDIFTDDDIDCNGSVKRLVSDTSRFEEVKGLYTDTPYKVLDTYAYYE